MIKFFLISAIATSFFAQTTPVLAQRNTRNLVCESHRGRYNFCDVDTRGGVRLVRQISNAECRQGSSWGYDRNGIWVDRGCTAEFAVRDNSFDSNVNSGGGDNIGAVIGTALVIGGIAAALSDNNANNSISGNNITCGSDRGNFNRCGVRIDRRDRVVLRRQLSNAGCWEGDTWGYDRDGVWVDRGCRAQFEVIRR